VRVYLIICDSENTYDINSVEHPPSVISC